MDEHIRFAATACLDAIERHRVATTPQAESAAVCEWLWWWCVLDEHTQPSFEDATSKVVRAALREARNAAAHRAVSRTVSHSSRVGELRVGLTALGQEQSHSWVPVEWLPMDGRGKRQQQARDAYAEHLAGRPTLETAQLVESWVAGLA